MLANTLPKLRKYSRTTHWITGTAVCVALAILYVVSRTEVHTFDALSYTWALEAKPFGLLFHPHHLFYGPVGWLAYKGAVALGYSGHADLPVQLVNGVAGGLGVFFFWRFGTRWTGRSMASLGVGLLIGLSYAYWVYAAEVEVYTLATAFLTLALWTLLILDEQPRKRWAVALGLVHTGAIMFHQTNVLFGLAIGVFLLLRPRLRRLSILLSYGLAILIPVTLSYGYVAYASQFSGWDAFYSWLTDYAQSGQWGGYLSFVHFPALRSGLQLAVSNEAWLAAVFYALGLVGLAAGLYQGWRYSNRRGWLGLAAVWLATYLIFFWWWEPWNIEFWIATLPLWGLLMLSAWPPAGEGDPVEAGLKVDKVWVAKAIYAVLPFALAFLLFQAHYAPIQEMGDATTDYYRQVSDTLATVVHEDELVISRGNVLDLYIPFYSGHPHLLSMRQLEQEKGGDRAQIMGELIAQLDWATVTGRPFLIDQFILDEEREAIGNPFGLTPAEIEQIKSRYTLEPVAFRGQQPLFYGSPRYDKLDRKEWEFAESLQGWGTYGVESPRFEDGGWCFTGGVDPQMKGPLIDLDADAWTRLVLDMTVEEDDSELQIFWRSPETTYTLENSLTAPLKRGRHLYEIELAGEPAWTSHVAQIRVDPIPGIEGDQSGVKACVHGIRFERP